MKSHLNCFALIAPIFLVTMVVKYAFWISIILEKLLEQNLKTGESKEPLVINSFTSFQVRISISVVICVFISALSIISIRNFYAIYFCVFFKRA